VRNIGLGVAFCGKLSDPSRFRRQNVSMGRGTGRGPGLPEPPRYCGATGGRAAFVYQHKRGGERVPGVAGMASTDEGRAEFGKRLGVFPTMWRILEDASRFLQ
jgi:hypothetical protein